MTGIAKTLLYTGNGQNLATYSEDGAHLNRKPIAEYYPYVISSVSANRDYIWDFSILQHNVIPITLFASKSTGVAQNDNLTITIKNAFNNASIWQLNLAGNKTIIGNAFFFTFPFMIVGQTNSATINSSSTLDQILVLGEKCYLESPIPPSY
jgi:hypothetical protein